MNKYIIERDIPGVGKFTAEHLQGAATASNAALAALAPKVQWLQSFVTADKTFCVYLAENEAGVQRHAELSGFPANRVIQVSGVIDPTTAG
ncbi:hypothetical protein BH11PSE2_BH11PSE2_13970 [soil metagenome]